jgi:hypothetical protein
VRLGAKAGLTGGQSFGRKRFLELVGISAAVAGVVFRCSFSRFLSSRASFRFALSASFWAIS